MKFSVLFLRGSTDFQPIYLDNYNSNTGFPAVAGNHYAVIGTIGEGAAQGELITVTNGVKDAQYTGKPSFTLITATGTPVTAKFKNASIAGALRVIDLGAFKGYNPVYLGSFSNSTGFDAEIGKHYAIFAVIGEGAAYGPIMVRGGTMDALTFSKPSATITTAIETKITANFYNGSIAGSLYVFLLD